MMKEQIMMKKSGKMGFEQDSNGFYLAEMQAEADNIMEIHAAFRRGDLGVGRKALATVLRPFVMELNRTRRISRYRHDAGIVVASYE